MARTDYLRNEIFFYETEIFYININPILPIADQIENYKIKSFVQDY